MNSSQPFTIYNASAGSGKTFSLVKEFLKKILSNSQRNYYKHLLAITFTNKAVAEMKERIIRMLVSLSSETMPEADQGMLDQLMAETSLSSEEIKVRAQSILKHLLHNYAQFSVETIDHFNHRLIRTFARDLKLPPNFEVSLNVAQLIEKAVDQLIEKAGQDEAITNLLLEFALQKTDDDKSWDIALDLKKTASLLANENDAAHLKKIKNKSLANFVSLRKELQKDKTKIKQAILQLAKSLLSLFEKHQIDSSFFSGGYAYTFFQKIAVGDFKVNFDTAWQRNIGIKPLYSSKIKGADAELMDALTPQIGKAFLDIKTQVYQFFKLENFLKNLVPLATVNLVNQELQKIKEEENILPINEFNSLIHEQIKDQPAPFIYERLGDRYRDFFIDEFQDTSLLQWNNLIPLIDNAISQDYHGETQGSLLLVGDAKQSIYRWRGGLPEQFIDLYQDGTPFSLSEKVLKNLDTNYRSAQEIISFNNQFFSFVSGHFGDATHRELYEIGNKQKPTSKSNGFVQIEFVDANGKEEEHEVYPQKVHMTICELLKKGYQQQDICILTRTKKDGVIISQHLLENDASLSVISEETLLLNSAPTVLFLVNLLQISLTPSDEEIKMAVLFFLYDHLNISIPKHSFFSTFIKEPLSKISEELATLDSTFSFETLHRLPLYECLEYSINQLELNSNSDASLISFMDVVHRFTQRPEASKHSFLKYWETEKEKASIASNRETNAIKVMTIHKSKGLEFPVVIFPYANTDIYKEIEPTAWYPHETIGFDELLINYKAEVSQYGPEGEALVHKRRNTLELDNLNLLYVALTRPIQELYIFVKKEKQKDIPSKYNHFLQEYLVHLGIWSEEKTQFNFGVSQAPSTTKERKQLQAAHIKYIASPPEAHNINIVLSPIAIENKDKLASIHIGNVLHDTMAKIEYATNTYSVLQELELQWEGTEQDLLEIKALVSSIVTHASLKHLFEPSEKVYNERDIITQQQFIRPDRVNVHPDGSATIVDYKTGTPKNHYISQISGYAAAVESLGFTVKEKLIVYANLDGILINKT